MLTLKIAIGSIALLTIGTAALAHDIITPHQTRGECERALAQINNEDRKAVKPFLPELDLKPGAVNPYLHARFSCEKRGNEWFIVDHFPNDG